MVVSNGMNAKKTHNEYILREKVSERECGRRWRKKEREPLTIRTRRKKETSEDGHIGFCWKKCCDARENLHATQTHIHLNATSYLPLQKKTMLSVFQIVFVAHNLFNCICDLVFMGTGVLAAYSRPRCGSSIAQHLFSHRIYSVSLACIYVWSYRCQLSYSPYNSVVRTLLTRIASGINSEAHQCRGAQRMRDTTKIKIHNHSEQSHTEHMDVRECVHRVWLCVGGGGDGGVYRMTPSNRHAHYRKRIEHTKNNIIHSVWMMNLTAIIVFWLGHKGVTLLPIGHEVFIYS